MVKRAIVKLIILCLLLFNFQNCGSRNLNKEQEDSFYVELGGWDYKRIPLIKPYEIINVNPEIDKSWTINLSVSSKLRQGQIGNLKKVSVTDSIIYAVSGDSSIFVGSWVKEAWYIILPNQQLEKGFLTESEFSLFINQQNYPKPMWLEIDPIWKKFSAGEELPWYKE